MRTRAIAGTAGTGGEHETLDTLVHALAEDALEEPEWIDGRLTRVTTWTDATRTKKIREVIYTRQAGCAGRVARVDTVQYDAAGVELYRIVRTIDRSAQNNAPVSIASERVS